jgi:drug/metabolite transporter (DMT)-like permease
LECLPQRRVAFTGDLTKVMFFIFLAAVLWGVTNPLLKKYTAGFDTAVADGLREPGWKGEVAFLLKRPKYLATQAANLSGSAAFFFGLRTVDLSIGAVVANALTLAITCVVSVGVLREGAPSLRSSVGVVLIMVGVSICTYSKESA